MADKFKFSDYADKINPLEQPASKPFKFSDYSQDAKPTKGGNLFTDTVQDVGIGTLRIPETLTGIADIPFGLAGMDRPVSKLADRAGEFTGITPGKWADQAEQTVFSPERQLSSQNVQQAWQDYESGDKSFIGALGETVSNPRSLLGNVVQSLPSMVAGGAIGKALSAGSKIAPALGEGLVMSGQQMANIDPSVDPQKAAALSLGTGLAGGAIGYGGSRIANKLGILDPDTLLSTGVSATTKEPLSLGKRIGFGAAQEGLFEELPQSVIEQGSQNIAENKPFTQDMAQAATLGTLAGGAMGGAFNIMQPNRQIGPQWETPTAVDIPKGPLGNALQNSGINPQQQDYGRTDTTNYAEPGSNGERYYDDGGRDSIPTGADGTPARAYQGLGESIGSGINAQDIVNQNTIPGIGTQQAIDQQFQLGGYNPLAGAWETPNVKDVKSPIQAKAQEQALGRVEAVSPTQREVSSTKEVSKNESTSEKTTNANETRQGQEGLLSKTIAPSTTTGSSGANLNSTHITSEGVPVIATDTPNVWFDGTQEIEDNYAQPITGVQDESVSGRTTQDVPTTTGSVQGATSGERRPDVGTEQGSGRDGGGISNLRIGGNDSQQAGSGDSVNRAALKAGDTVSVKGTTIKSAKFLETYERPLKGFGNVTMARVELPNGKIYEHALYDDLERENVSDTYKGLAGNKETLQLPNQDANVSRKRQDISKTTSDKTKMVAGVSQNATNQSLKDQLIKNGMPSSHAEVLLNTIAKAPAAARNGIAKAFAIDRTDKANSHPEWISGIDFSKEQTNDLQTDGGKIQGNATLLRDKGVEVSNRISEKTSANVEEKTKQRPRKLTDKIKYTIEDGHAVLWAINKETNKLEPALTSHIATLDVIKKDGFKAANERGLLAPYKPQEKNEEQKNIEKAATKTVPEILRTSDGVPSNEINRGLTNGQLRTDSSTIQPNATKPQPTDRPVSTEDDVNYRDVTEGKISVADFGKKLGLTEEEIDDAIIGKFYGKASTPYSDLINEVRGEIESKKAALKKPSNYSGSSGKAYLEKVSNWNAALETLNAAEREYENPFSSKVSVSRNYKTLPDGLKAKFAKRFESMATGDEARKSGYRADAKRKADALVALSKTKQPVQKAVSTDGDVKQIPVLTEEEYLAQQGYGRYTMGEAALHHNKGRNSDKTWKKMVDAQAKKDQEIIIKRGELSKEYQDKVSKGEIRQPSALEQRIATANGNPDNEATQAARRLLEKKGIDWRQPVQKPESFTNNEQNVKQEPEKGKSTPKPQWETPTYKEIAEKQLKELEFPAYEAVQGQADRRGKPWTKEQYNKYHDAAIAIGAANAQLALDDPGTTVHENRVAASVSILAKKLGLQKDQVVRATVASMGHDLGKRGMKDLLGKQGKLTPDEFGIIRSHPEQTRAIMREMGLSDDIIKTASEHHETKKGGYPVHQDTPDFTSQVVQLADVADSLIGGKDSGHTYPLRFNGKELPRTVASVETIMEDMVEKGEINKEIYAAYKDILTKGEIPNAQKAELERNGDVPWVKVERNKLLPESNQQEKVVSSEQASSTETLEEHGVRLLKGLESLYQDKYPGILGLSPTQEDDYKKRVIDYLIDDVGKLWKKEITSIVNKSIHQNVYDKNRIATLRTMLREIVKTGAFSKKPIKAKPEPKTAQDANLDLKENVKQAQQKKEPTVDDIDPLFLLDAYIEIKDSETGKIERMKAEDAINSYEADIKEIKAFIKCAEGA